MHPPLLWPFRASESKQRMRTQFNLGKARATILVLVDRLHQSIGKGAHRLARERYTSTAPLIVCLEEAVNTGSSCPLSSAETVVCGRRRLKISSPPPPLSLLEIQSRLQLFASSIYLDFDLLQLSLGIYFNMLSSFLARYWPDSDLSATIFPPASKFSTERDVPNLAGKVSCHSRDHRPAISS